MARIRVRIVAIVALSVITAFVAAYWITRTARHQPVAAAPARPRLPAVLGSATAVPAARPTGAAGTPPTAAGVTRAVGPLAQAPALGGRLLARVVDAATGAVLFDRNGTTPAAPASTAKLLTAAAILAVHQPTDRFTTTVVEAGHGTIVFVGGGDPTLSAAKPGTSTTYAGAARISDLAAQIRAAKIPVRRIVVDDALFPGPSVATSWDPADMGTSYGAPITPVIADAGQTGPQGTARSGNPDLSAGADLAAALGHPGLPVSRGRAPAGATKIASVQSAPLAELIPQMLLESDNVIADILARQVAVAIHRPASFDGATSAIRTVLARFGVHVGTGMKDGSGLSSADRVSPVALVGVLRLIAGYGPPASAPLRFIASALPVGGWSGTLDQRFGSGPAGGRVRAKTGTLSTVSSLAGLVRDSSGRLLAFSLDADRAVGTDAAEGALDAFVTALERCGCR